MTWMGRRRRPSHPRELQPGLQGLQRQCGEAFRVPLCCPLGSCPWWLAFCLSQVLRVRTLSLCGTCREATCVHVALVSCWAVPWHAGCEDTACAHAQHLPRPAAATRAMPSCSWPVALCQGLAPEACGSLLGPGSPSLARVFEDSVKSFV